MKTLAFLFMSLATIAPVQAQNDLGASQPIRTRYVYSLAFEGCPKFVQLEHTPNGDKSMEFLDRVIKAAKLNRAEGDLLVYMCFIYDHGRRGDQSPLQ